MSVEFLPGGDPGDAPEEQLDVSQRSRLRGWWVLVVLVAGLTVWALTRPAQAPSQRLTRPTPPAATISGTASTVSTTAEAPCRALAGCAVRVGVPPSIARLARAYLPAGMQLQVRTVVASGSLTKQDPFVTRDVDAHAGSVTVLIRVQRGGSRTQEIAPDPLGVGSLLLHQVNAGFVVRLQYLAPETVPPVLSRLRALISDPRLTAA
jgi:hypothetical protein